MKWKTKWILACILSVSVVAVAKLEERQLINIPVTQYVTTGKDFVVMKKWVSSLIGEEESITVSSGTEFDPFASYDSFQPYQDGAIISYSQPMSITSQGSGLVVFTGYTRQSGKTVTVQYDNGDEVTYGFVGSFSTLPYTTVRRGDEIAVMDEDAVYVRVKRNGIPLEPTVLATYMTGGLE
ncbi:peptidoglycan DD-metalloendopeptidase family protein [Sporosarcina cascadiensis]|uniref:peptidoglycan DD-metalloendopeptidase family protein n=1 Tax=Sporosarcina cascadiensis TaxID=2660747 RepID=UPI0018914258|nr:peptidoglycan DD-metalloendopeptidase family protein [Sporosarcina cascadiensis]